jgi:hypothetical protein
LGSECFYLYVFILFCSASKALSISIQANFKVEILKTKKIKYNIALELGKRGEKGVSAQYQRFIIPALERFENKPNI